MKALLHNEIRHMSKYTFLNTNYTLKLTKCNVLIYLFIFYEEDLKKFLFLSKRKEYIQYKMYQYNPGWVSPINVPSSSSIALTEHHILFSIISNSFHWTVLHSIIYWDSGFLFFQVHSNIKQGKSPKIKSLGMLFSVILFTIQFAELSGFSPIL